MTTYHQVPLTTLPVETNKKVNNQYQNHTPLGLSITSSSTSLSSDLGLGLGQSELLPDLWLGPSPSTSTGSDTFKFRSNSVWSEQEGNNIEYAKSLLPNNLLDSNVLPNNLLDSNVLPALTEENLLFNTNPTIPPPQAAPQAAPQQIQYYNYQPTFSDHSNEEIFNFEQQKPIPPTSPKLKQQNVNTQLYKTELCASFMKMGLCPYGNKCQFAHGENELKLVERPPQWRSKPCANWSKFGSCRYGNRCCFKHGD